MRLTKTEKEFLASAVSRLGNGAHPVLNQRTLPYFKEEYLISILKKAKSQVTAKGLVVVDSILNKLSK